MGMTHTICHGAACRKSCYAHVNQSKYASLPGVRVCVCVGCVLLGQSNKQNAFKSYKTTFQISELAAALDRDGEGNREGYQKGGTEYCAPQT